MPAQGRLEALDDRWWQWPALSGQSVSMDEWLESDVDLTFGTGFSARHRDRPGLWGGGADCACIQDPEAVGMILDHRKKNGLGTDDPGARSAGTAGLFG